MSIIAKYFRLIVIVKNRSVMHNIRKETTNNDDDYNYLLMKTDSILNTFNKLLGKVFVNPIASTSKQVTFVCEPIRNSRKSFRLNEPAAFNETFNQRRPYVPARAILSLTPNKPSDMQRRFITTADDEVEVFCILNNGINDNETVVTVYGSDSDDDDEIMKVYVDNAPPKMLVQREQSTWKLIPLKTRRGGCWDDEKVGKRNMRVAAKRKRSNFLFCFDL